MRRIDPVSQNSLCGTYLSTKRSPPCAYPTALAMIKMHLNCKHNVAYWSYLVSPKWSMVSLFIIRSEKFCHWLKIFSEISNIHGVKWHLYVKKMPLKILCVTFIFFVIFAMPAILINEALKFFSPAAINTAVELGREDTMKYPNITVCFAKFFDQTLLDRKAA